MAVIKAARRINREADLHLEQAEHQLAIEALAERFGPVVEGALGSCRAVEPGDAGAPDITCDLIVTFTADAGGLELGGAVKREEFLAQGACDGFGKQVWLPSPASGGQVVCDGAEAVVPRQEKRGVQLC